MIWCFVFLADMAFFLTDTALYFSNCYGILFFASRPCNPPCHPERSGTTRQKSRATTNLCRTANPAPSGAPAGGISIAERCYIKQRNPQKSLPLEEKVYCGEWLRYVVPLADFALIRRFAPPSPPGGRLFRGFRCFMWYLLAMEIPPAGAPLGAGFAVRQ